MPQYNYGGDWTQYKLSPINRIWLIDEGPPAGWDPESTPAALVTCDVLRFAEPESDSTAQLQAITRRTSYGGSRQVGLMFTATVNFALGNLVDYEQLLDQNMLRKRLNVKIQFGGYNYMPAGYETYYLYLMQIPDLSCDNRMEVTYERELQGALRWRLKLSMSGRIERWRDIYTTNDTYYW
jgi:hypothetical protein